MKISAISTKAQTMISEIASALLILLFAYTAMMKLIEHNSFEAALSQPGLTGRAAMLLSWLIPFAELITVALLCMRYTRRYGFILSAVLMCTFTGYIFYMLMFVPNLPCSCGGVIKKMSWSEHLIFNLCFTVIAFTGMLFSNRRTSLLQ